LPVVAMSSLRGSTSFTGRFRRCAAIAGAQIQTAVDLAAEAAAEAADVEFHLVLRDAEAPGEVVVEGAGAWALAQTRIVSCSPEGEARWV
jgi:hypothetical protein